MTGAPPVLDRLALRAALSHMRIDLPDGARFEDTLARENGWTRAFAERVADEYCGFLYLAATAGFEVTPSQSVDQAWHLHLASPHYREILCREILGRPLEHRPGTGTPEDEARCRRQYEETLGLYESVFGKPAPDDIWPRPVAAEEPEPARPRDGHRLGYQIAAAALALAGATQASGLPAIVLGLAGTALIFPLVIRALQLEGARSRNRASGDCGGGGGDPGDGGCGASCGGGCGGE